MDDPAQPGVQKQQEHKSAGSKSREEGSKSSNWTETQYQSSSRDVRRTRSLKIWKCMKSQKVILEWMRGLLELRCWIQMMTWMNVKN